MKYTFTEEMKSARYAFDVKATYTYRVHENGNGEMTISVQKTEDFKKGFLPEDMITMAVDTFDRMSVSDINWIIDTLRTECRYGCDVYGSVDGNGFMSAEESISENMSATLEKAFELAERDETSASDKKIVQDVKNHIEWIATVFPDDKKRAIEQAYGFIQGVSFVRDDLFDEITEVWEKFHARMLYGK